MVTPKVKEPLSGSISPARIWKRVVFERLFLPTKAILSLVFTVKLISFSTFSPSIVLVRFLTSRMTLPQGRSGLKAINGYLLEDTGISSKVIFSRSFFREVACFDLDALELNRWIKALSSLARSVSFLFSDSFCFRFNWLAWYQKS